MSKLAVKPIMRRAVNTVLMVGSLIAAVVITFSLVVWADAEELVIQSEPLGEHRRLVMYNQHGQSGAPIIIALDGDKLRHGLAPAVQARLLSMVSGKPTPIIIAVDGMGKREGDFRNVRSQPAEWRPVVSGRAPLFDAFLIREVFPLAERQANHTSGIYLFGHSLAGLYTADFSTRNPALANYRGFAAFSPTFSHDLSVIGRLPQLCRTKLAGLMTIGLESSREMELFKAAENHMADAPDCQKSAVSMARHPGAIHQIVMLPGQAHALATVIGE